MTVTGIPPRRRRRAQRPAIERSYYGVDGTPASLDEVRQNDRFVVVLSVRRRSSARELPHRRPAAGGFEIENPDLSQAEGVGELN